MTSAQTARAAGAGRGVAGSCTRSTSTSASIPTNLHAREVIARRRARRRAADHRRLPAGLAALRHRLELAARARAGRGPARGRRHRLALAGPDGLPDRPPRRRRDGRPDDVHARAQASRSATSRRSRPRRRQETRDRAIETEDAAGLLVRFEGGARGVVTLSQVSAGRKNHLHWEVNGSQAAPPGAPSGRRSCGSATATRRTSCALRDPRPARAVRRRAHEHARRPRRGLRRDVPRALPRRLQRGRGRRAARRARTTRPSPTGTSRR